MKRIAVAVLLMSTPVMAETISGTSSGGTYSGTSERADMGGGPPAPQTGGVSNPLPPRAPGAIPDKVTIKVPAAGWELDPSFCLEVMRINGVSLFAGNCVTAASVPVTYPAGNVQGTYNPLPPSQTSGAPPK